MLYQQLFAAVNENINTPALWAGLQVFSQLVFLTAGAAAEHCRAAFKVERRSFAQSALADAVPEELHGIIHNRRKLTDYQIDIGNFRGMIFFQTPDSAMDRVFRCSRSLPLFPYVHYTSGRGDTSRRSSA